MSPYDEAECWLEHALCEKPSATWVCRPQLTTNINAGRLEEARQTAARFLEAFPGMMVTRAIEATLGDPGFLSH
jgi:adenylate cyclase